MIRFLIVISLFFFGSCAFSQEYKGKLCWQPPILPIEFCSDHEGNIEAKSSRSWNSPFGTIKAQGIVYPNQEIKYKETVKEITNNEYLLVINYEENKYLFKIEKGVQLDFESQGNLNATFKEGIIEIDASNTSLASFTLTDERNITHEILNSLTKINHSDSFDLYVNKVTYEAYVFYHDPSHLDLNTIVELEYYYNQDILVIVYKNEVRRRFNYLISPQLKTHLLNSNEIWIILVDDETGDSVEGITVPFKIKLI